jgi:hypothetical protein
MANEEHLAILRQGVEAWNAWRKANPKVKPWLSQADLTGAKLAGVDLKEVVLHEAILQGADLTKANLTKADLKRANLTQTDLTKANLTGAFLLRANLNGTILLRANLRGAVLTGAVLHEAILQGADLTRTILHEANLTGTILHEANLTRAVLHSTVLANNDLSTCKGLDSIFYSGPTEVSVSTLVKSKGKIPESFLRGCGVPESFIEYLPALLGAMEPIQFYSCFISYSTKDEAFAKRLHGRMQQEHLRVWFAPEDIEGGKKLHEQIEYAIQYHDRLLLILSDNSLQSEWVMTELYNARQVELKENRRKLFPIRLTDMDTIKAWKCFDADTGKDLAREIREYYIPDFSHWKEHDSFEHEFAKLLNALRATEAPPIPRAPSPSKPKTMPQNAQTVINAKKRRLEKLEEQAAIKGISTPPEVANEIEDLRRELGELESGQA